MRKITIILLSLLFISCSNNSYIKMTKKGFVSSEIKDISKKVLEKATYYKNDYSKKYWKEDVFLFIEDGEKLKMHMGINYRGKEWLYMKDIEFIGNENLVIDFFDYKTFNPVWKDNTTLSMKVEEKILFPVEDNLLDSLGKIIMEKNVKVILRSDYDDRFHMRTLSEEESIRMKKILDLYKSIKEEKERKTDGN